MSEEQIADEALALIRDGKLEAGASILVRKLSKRVQRYFERHSVPPGEAEELVTETWFKVTTSKFRGDTRAIVWIWTIARSVLRDWVDARDAQKRGEGSEQSFADSVWDVILSTVQNSDAPHWLVLCVQRAAFQFEQDEPQRAQVLRLCCDGWSAEEIAVYFGAEPPVTDKQKTAARTRVYDATRQARDYFQHCRDEA